MGLMKELAGTFQKAFEKAKQEASKENLGPLEELLKDQRQKQNSVNLRPYSPPEDRYEGFANDYGEDLYDHYVAACSIIEEEIRNLKQS